MDILWMLLAVIVAAVGMFVIHMLSAIFRHWLLYMLVTNFSIPVKTRFRHTLILIWSLRLLGVGMCLLYAVTVIKFML